MRVVVPLSLVLGLLPVGAAYGVESRAIVEEFEVAPEQAVRINLSVAEVRVETASSKKVKEEITLRCRWSREDCEEALEEIELVCFVDAPKAQSDQPDMHPGAHKIILAPTTTLFSSRRGRRKRRRRDRPEGRTKRGR